MFRTLLPDLPESVNLPINSEISLKQEARASLLQCVGWISGGGLVFSEMVAKTLGPVPKDTSSLAFPESFRQLRESVVEASAKLTSYKYLLASAIVSPRPAKELFPILKRARDFINLSRWESGVIHDAVVGETALMVTPSYKLTESERLAIVALCCLLLRIDQMTHVSETESLRVVTTSLRSGSIQPPALMAAMGKSPAVLFSELGQAGKVWAMYFLIKIASSDGTLRPSETKYILTLAKEGEVAPHTFLEIQKINYLESELNVPSVF